MLVENQLGSISVVNSLVSLVNEVHLIRVTVLEVWPRRSPNLNALSKFIPQERFGKPFVFKLVPFQSSRE